MEKYAREELEAFLKAHFDGLPGVETRTASGVPYREIVREARECGAGLIVIGTHGRTGVERVIFGSTAEKVVRMSPCPCCRSAKAARNSFIRIRTTNIARRRNAA